jgi:hypothetical protein
MASNGPSTKLVLQKWYPQIQMALPSNSLQAPHPTIRKQYNASAPTKDNAPLAYALPPMEMTMMNLLTDYSRHRKWDKKLDGLLSDVNTLALASAQYGA